MGILSKRKKQEEYNTAKVDNLQSTPSNLPIQAPQYPQPQPLVQPQPILVNPPQQPQAQPIIPTQEPIQEPKQELVKEEYNFLAKYHLQKAFSYIELAETAQHN